MSTTRPELVEFDGLGVAALDPHALRPILARGWQLAQLAADSGAISLAVLLAAGRPRALRGRSWARVDVRAWRARRGEVDAFGLVPEVRQVCGNLPRLIEDLGHELSQCAPVDDRAEVAFAVAREIVTNALVHRSFGDDAIGRSVVVELYTDGFVVRSPGAAPLRHGSAAFSRNPTLHALAAALGHGTQRGTGWRYVLRSARLVGWCAERGDEEGWHVVRVSIDPDAVDAAAAQAVRHRVPTSDAEVRVLDQLGAAPRTARELVEMLGLPGTTVRRVLRVLIERGLVRRTRPGARSRHQAYVRVS